MEPKICNVVHYSYRSALVIDRYLTLPRDAVKELERELVKLSNIRNPDNHTCYAFQVQHGKTVYVMFSDLRAYFGNGIEIRNW